MKVLIDTSIWSLAFRKAKKDQSEQQIIEKLQNLIKDHRAMIIGPIRQELLSGISSKSTFNKLKTLLEAFPDVILNTFDYERAAEMYNSCREKGIQGSHINYLICSVAERQHFSIFTLDKDFDRYAKHVPIILFN